MTQESSSPPVEEQESRGQESKESRRQERRERRARRARQRASRQRDLLRGMDGYMYSDTCHVLPDILNSHVPPPPYTTLPRHVAEAGTRGNTSNRSGGTWRAALTGFSRRSRNPDADAEGAAGCEGHQAQGLAQDSKTCCGVVVSQTVSIRWFIVMIAFVGICCAVVGTVLGAMKASGREHLTVSLLMIGVGIVLITVSGIAWRLTSQDGPSCRAMLGLGGYSDYNDGRFLTRPPGYPRGHGASAHPYSGMMYTEFQYRPPPPSYQASMQEYRLRLLLMDRSGGAPLPPPPPVMSPPPAYRSTRHGPLGLDGPAYFVRNGLGVPGHEVAHEMVSRPPSYRSRASDLPVPIHARHSSQLSYLSYAGAPMEAALETEEDKVEAGDSQHASVVSVIPRSGNKASIQISADMDQYMTNIQHQFGRIQGSKDKSKDGVTIVQSQPQSSSVVVTVSGAVDQAGEASGSEYSGAGKVDITAHL